VAPTEHTSSSRSSITSPLEFPQLGFNVGVVRANPGTPFVTGVLLALSAALGFGATAFFARLSIEHMRPTTGTLVSLVVGVVVTSVLALSIDGTAFLSLDSAAYPLMFLAGFASFVGGRLLNFVAVSKIGVSRSSPIVGASPLIATALAVLLAGESLNTPIIVGTIAIISGIAIVLRQ
jgi:drug/metabolite transporter (DMT)-like permease